MDFCCDCADECTVDRTGFYTFTVAGVTGTDCSYANRGYCLAYDRCGCLGEVWADSGNGEPFQAILFLVCHGGSQTAQLWIGRYPDEMPLAVYELDFASWTAAGPNVLTRTDANATCGDWPATITVSKSGSCSTEDCGCADTTTKATAFEFTLSGVTPDSGGGTACICGPLNRTWCIAYSGFCQWQGAYEVTGCDSEVTHVFSNLSALCSDDQTCGADLYFGYVAGLGPVGVTSYHSDAFSCETGGVFTFVGSANPCNAASFPATITLTASELCTPDPLPCQCTPKSAYSPRVELRGIVDETCGDCSCAADLSLCFTAYGADDEDCLWICEFTFPTGDPVACTSTATYAILNLFDGDVISLTFYNSSDAIVARYEASLYDFDCQASDYPLHRTFQDDTCTWPADDTSLYMLGDECPACSCDDGSWSVSIEYDGEDHTFCFAATDCEGVSDSSEIFGGGGDSLYVEVEFGTLPAQFVRLRVYYLASGDPIGSGTLIGVYNFLADIASFDCAGSTNTLDLATGNAGQCGYLVDESGYTELLGAAAFLSHEDSCCTPAEYDTPGTYEYATTAGLTYTIECWASGNGGNKIALGISAAGGPGGPAYSRTVWVSDGSTITVVVPAGGVGHSSFPTLGDDCYATIPGPTTLCLAVAGSQASGQTGGAGGQASSGIGDVKYSGGDGGYGYSGGGGGGGSAGPSGPGNDGADSSLSDGSGGAGGAAVTGGGAGGDGGNADTFADGTDGTFPGGSGGGGPEGVFGYGGSGADGKAKISCG